MKKELPLKYPTITSWDWTATTFAVLENHKQCNDWIFNNFVQIFSERYQNIISLHFLPHIDVFSMCPFFCVSLIPRCLISSDIITFFKKCIDKNFYIYCIVDVGSIIYNKKFPHEITLYGYDDSLQEFNVASFILNKGNKYSFSTLSYQQLLTAYNNISNSDDDLEDGMGGKGGILLFKFNQDMTYNFDFNLFTKNILDYLDSTDSGKIYRPYNILVNRKNYGIQKVSYGMEIYNELIFSLNNLENLKRIYFIQPLHVLYDHKVFMTQCLKYLKSKYNLSIPSNIIQEYDNLAKEILYCRNAAIKYSIDLKKENFISVIYKLMNVRDREYRILTTLLEKTLSPYSN